MYCTLNRTNKGIKFSFKSQKYLQNCFIKIQSVGYKRRGGHLLEIHLLETELLNTFYKNLICLTEKCQLLKKKYAIHVPHIVFEQLIKKVQLLKILSN